MKVYQTWNIITIRIWTWELSLQWAGESFVTTKITLEDKPPAAPEKTQGERP